MILPAQASKCPGAASGAFSFYRDGRETDFPGTEVINRLLKKSADAAFFAYPV